MEEQLSNPPSVCVCRDRWAPGTFFSFPSFTNLKKIHFDFMHTCTGTYVLTRVCTEARKECGIPRR